MIPPLSDFLFFNPEGKKIAKMIACLILHLHTLYTDKSILWHHLKGHWCTTMCNNQICSILVKSDKWKIISFGGHWWSNNWCFYWSWTMTSTERPLLLHWEQEVLLWILLAGNRQFYWGCGCFLKKMYCSTLNTFCFNAPALSWFKLKVGVWKWN